MLGTNEGANGAGAGITFKAEIPPMPPIEYLPTPPPPINPEKPPPPTLGLIA